MSRGFLLMKRQEIIPHLFRTEYHKIIAVLCSTFGFDHIETAEDIVSDTFLTASETWGINGMPDKPLAWLYTVAKNKSRNYLKHSNIFKSKVGPVIKTNSPESYEANIDLSVKNIKDSQLQMLFAVCHPAISAEAQISLSLRILCGFGIDEIADAFLISKETVTKRLYRGKETLRTAGITTELPEAGVLNQRLDNVLTTLYLLFNEGYYSVSNNNTLRKELCLEALRLTYQLTENKKTNLPQVNALLALMSFQVSRFEARTDHNGEMVLYQDQDESLWDNDLIGQGKYFLEKAATGNQLSKYHLEAGIAYWHTVKEDSALKWENILSLYNYLLALCYSPVAALNRTYALYKCRGRQTAIAEAEKLNLLNNHLYFALLGELYTSADNQKAALNLKAALKMAKTTADKQMLEKKLAKLT